MKRIHVPIGHTVIDITARLDKTGWSVVGFGSATSVRSKFCEHPDSCREFARVLLFACDVGDNDDNIQCLVEAIQNLIAS